MPVYEIEWFALGLRRETRRTSSLTIAREILRSLARNDAVSFVRLDAPQGAATWRRTGQNGAWVEGRTR